eukprot:TRINITY_DN6988_c2_g1_i1.p5 TRINITY_DN6988_c2_g1~~TRINITY_DN6988_c2_g1_i1.p5  ORF type:complete len:123 (-),score=10.40 TRINITY_DN6988_c2_g1_i1:162-509(-)
MTINSDDFATEHHKQPLNVSWLQKIADFMDPSYLFYDEEQGWPHLSEDVPVTLIITANLGKLSCKLEVIWGYISGIQLYVKLFEQVFRGFIGVVIFFSGFCQILSRLFCGILLDV